MSLSVSLHFLSSTEQPLTFFVNGFWVWLLHFSDDSLVFLGVQQLTQLKLS